MQDTTNPEIAELTDTITFLGTAGARFVVTRQFLASGGAWLSLGDTQILLDPGPGSLVQAAKRKLDPTKRGAIILSHRHLDHSNDINVMIEAMTHGGHKKRGVVFCPRDAVAEDPVILKHTRRLVKRLEILKANADYRLGNFRFKTSMRHKHQGQTYGIKFNTGKTSVSLLTDTKYFPQLADFYSTDILIICVIFLKPRPDIDHLSVEDVGKIIKQVKPRKVVLTHFGLTMLRARPQLIARRLSEEFNTDVVAAYDGMSMQL